LPCGWVYRSDEFDPEPGSLWRLYMHLVMEDQLTTTNEQVLWAHCWGDVEIPSLFSSGWVRLPLAGFGQTASLRFP
jgi:hypothetical protein